jgi:hypothetical protein
MLRRFRVILRAGNRDRFGWTKLDHLELKESMSRSPAPNKMHYLNFVAVADKGLGPV